MAGVSGPSCCGPSRESSQGPHIFVPDAVWPSKCHCSPVPTADTRPRPQAPLGFWVPLSQLKLWSQRWGRPGAPQPGRWEGPLTQGPQPHAAGLAGPSWGVQTAHAPLGDSACGDTNVSPGTAVLRPQVRPRPRFSPSHAAAHDQHPVGTLPKEGPGGLALLSPKGPPAQQTGEARAESMRTPHRPGSILRGGRTTREWM